MSKTFLVSDPHFGHAGVCRFLRADGITKLRPFETPDEMDEFMVASWNSRVSPNDKVYVLGDVVINRRALKTLGRLNGDKVLIKGNHDIFRLDEYTEYFRDVRAYHVLNGMILSHIPVHSDSLGRFGVNIHGHLHDRRVKQAQGVDAITGEILYSDKNDVRYHNVCVENLPDFAPITLEEVIERIKSEGGTVGFTDGNGPNMM